MPGLALFQKTLPLNTAWYMLVHFISMGSALVMSMVLKLRWQTLHVFEVSSKRLSMLKLLSCVAEGDTRCAPRQSEG